MFASGPVRSSILSRRGWSPLSPVWRFSLLILIAAAAGPGCTVGEETTIHGLSAVRVVSGNTIEVTPARNAGMLFFSPAGNVVTNRHTIEAGQVFRIGDARHVSNAYVFLGIRNGKVVLEARETFDARSFGKGVTTRKRVVAVAPYSNEVNDDVRDATGPAELAALETAQAETSWGEPDKDIACGMESQGPNTAILILKNTSRKTRWVYPLMVSVVGKNEVAFGPFVRVRLYGDKGKEIPGRESAVRQDVRFHELEAGRSIQFQFDVRPYFDIKESGVYRLHAQITGLPVTLKKDGPEVAATMESGATRVAVYREQDRDQAIGSSRAALLNVYLDKFSLRMSNHRENLEVNLMAQVEKPGPHWIPPAEGAHIFFMDREQTEKVIRLLETDGFLAKASNTWRQDGPVYPPPRGGLTFYVSGARWAAYRQDLTGLPMFNRLEALRKILDGDAAKAIEELLGKLESHRNQPQTNVAN